MSQSEWAYFDKNINCWVYRASTVGSCTRSLVAARLGESAFPFNAGIRAAMDASSGLEDVMLNRVVAELGGTLLWQQKNVELDIPGNGHSREYVIRGHIDALRKDDDTIIEAKALGASNWGKYNSGGLDALGHLGKKYRMQGAVYGHATGRKVRFVIGHKEKWEMKDGTGTRHPEGDKYEIEGLIIEPPVTAESLVPLTSIIDRVHFIEDHASRDELPDCDQNCREGDPYSECHLFSSRRTGDEEDLDKLVRYDNLRELLGSQGEKDGTKRWGLLGEYEDLKDYFKRTYGDPRYVQTEKVDVGPFSMTIVANKGRESIDTKWLRKNHPDVAAAATKLGQPFHQLIVKRAEERDGD